MTKTEWWCIVGSMVVGEKAGVSTNVNPSSYNHSLRKLEMNVQNPNHLQNIVVIFMSYKSDDHSRFDRGLGEHMKLNIYEQNQNKFQINVVILMFSKSDEDSMFERGLEEHTKLNIDGITCVEDKNADISKYHIGG